MRQAVGTSLMVVAVLSIPTLIAHTALGHVDWAVAGLFALGVIPTSVVGAHYSSRFGAGMQRRYFGIVLVAFGLAGDQPGYRHRECCAIVGLWGRSSSAGSLEQNDRDRRGGLARRQRSRHQRAREFLRAAQFLVQLRQSADER
jgi:hypothetical protein